MTCKEKHFFDPRVAKQTGKYRHRSKMWWQKSSSMLYLCMIEGLKNRRQLTDDNCVVIFTNK